MLYPINETFYSIQGEGYHCGRPALFIRLAGCNLACPWCDTVHTVQYSAEPESILDKALLRVNNKLPNHPLVVLTGGEPTLYNLEELLQEIRRRLPDADIALETNGLRLVETLPVRRFNLLTWVTVSPKMLQADYEPLFANRKWWGQELKVVLEDGLDLQMLAELPRRLRGRFHHFYIQPLSQKFQPAVDFVQANPDWKLSVQLHKLLGVR